MFFEVSDLDVSYGKIQILWKIYLRVSNCEIVIIVGSNGAGKSTLLKSIVGSIPFDDGKILFKDKDIGGRPTYRIVEEGISLIPEGGQIFPYMTVWDNLDLGNYTRRKSRQKKETVEWIFNLFPILNERKHQLASTLSGGERQMLAMSIGLMTHPEFLLIDEPSSGLSPLYVKILMNNIKKIRDAGLTILLVEQNVNSAIKIADRGYVLENGKIILEGSGKELSDNLHVRTAYLGI